MKSSTLSDVESASLSPALKSVPLTLAGGVDLKEQTRTRRAKKILPDDAVHVWRVLLNQDLERTANALKVLSPDERETAARFHFDKDRNQFVQARAALRFILSEYIDLNPQDLEFTYGPQGKPGLAVAGGDLRFNLSRREGLALIAVTRGREIGVDVELVRGDMPFFEIAAVSFSNAESNILRNLPANLQSRGFYNCWTRKEAFVKAVGEGLSFPLQEFDVSLVPGESAELLEVRGSPLNRADRWTMHDFAVGENYVGALVVEGANLNFTHFVREPVPRRR
jgi:4'-phosphopantetheinyl transferase